MLKLECQFEQFRILPISSLTLCLLTRVCRADSSEASRASAAQRCRRRRTSEHSSFCGCSVSQPASLWAFRAVPQCNSTEESVCRNAFIWSAFTPLLIRNRRKANTWLKTRYLHLMSSDCMWARFLHQILQRVTPIFPSLALFLTVCSTYCSACPVQHHAFQHWLFYQR